MTPTEAIRHLGALSSFANADEVKAVEMAIKKLSEGPSIADLIAGIDLDFSRKKQKPGLVPRITRNAIECKSCLQTIESKHPHDYKTCLCRGCSVDGGLERLNRSGGNYIERSEWR